MEYRFGARNTGKSFAQMIHLKNNIENGKNCSVCTFNPEKTKTDFEYMTGRKLILLNTSSKNMYSASLATE